MTCATLDCSAVVLVGVETPAGQGPRQELRLRSRLGSTQAPLLRVLPERDQTAAMRRDLGD